MKTAARTPYAADPKNASPAFNALPETACTPSRPAPFNPGHRVCAGKNKGLWRSRAAATLAGVALSCGLAQTQQTAQAQTTHQIQALAQATAPVQATAAVQTTTPAQTAAPIAIDPLSPVAAEAGVLTTEPHWFLANGHPNPQVAAALQALSDADTQGLDPADYETTALIEDFARLAQAGSPAAMPEQQQRLGARLTASLTRYLNDLRNGRVDPHKVHQKFDVPAKPAFDARQYVAQALRDNRVEQALNEARPKVPMYDAVVKAMAHYRSLAADPVWTTPLPPLPSRKLEPGQTYAGIPLIKQRLAVLGDYAPQAATPQNGVTGTSQPADTAMTDPGVAHAAANPVGGNTAPSNDTTYSPALVDAVKAFQARHGLTVDGIIGPGTFAQLQITPAQRVEQMALTLERLRWTPLLSGPRMIVVNVPEFMLRAYEVKPDGTIDINLQMRVIVGRALDTSTPLFDEDMRFIEFSPYWNIPPSIARGETLPRLRRDPAYFNRQGFEFVMKDGSVSTELSQANLDAVQHGAARIRQRPGPQNALGDIKFIFPNNTNIYLHHTPAPQLFERARRDFSHGCIRVEAPVALAQFVLQNDPRWTQQRIETAMQAGKAQTIRLAEPIPVVLAYSTVVVLDGTVYFFDDIYGHDKKLANALKKRA